MDKVQCSGAKKSKMEQNVIPVGPSPDSKQYPVDKEGFYVKETGKKYRGKALIFSQISENDTEVFKKGYEKDEVNIAERLEELSFYVKKYRNKTVRQIKKILKEASEDKECNDKSDSFIVVVLTHGNQNESGQILLAEDDLYQEDILFENFDGESCKSLHGKPKLFFIQACRGEDYQQKSLLMDQKGNREGFERKRVLYYLPYNADFFIFRATFQGTVAWVTSEGSYFIKAICDELDSNKDDDYRSDMMTLMTYSVRRVATIVVREHPSYSLVPKACQQPFIMSTLTRLLYLRPKNS